LVEANALTANLSAAATELEPRREHADFLMRELGIAATINSRW
jgi:hypothetical protein